MAPEIMRRGVRGAARRERRDQRDDAVWIILRESAGARSKQRKSKRTTVFTASLPFAHPPYTACGITEKVSGGFIGCADQRTFAFRVCNKIFRTPPFAFGSWMELLAVIPLSSAPRFWGARHHGGTPCRSEPSSLSFSSSPFSAASAASAADRSTAPLLRRRRLGPRHRYLADFSVDGPALVCPPAPRRCLIGITGRENIAAREVSRAPLKCRLSVPLGYFL